MHALGLEVSDLFPPKSSSAATLKKRRLISAGQALNFLHDETHLVAVCAADMGRGEALDAKVQPAIGNPWPDMPPGIVDRNVGIWEALLSVADAAGGNWPKRSRVAAIAIVAESKAGTPSLGVRLLEDPTPTGLPTRAPRRSRGP